MWKITLGRTLLRLYDATAGEVSLKGIDVLNAPRTDEGIKKGMQIVFQDPIAH